MVSFDGGRITVEQGQIETPAGTGAGPAAARPGRRRPSTFTRDRAPALSLAAEPFRRYLGGELDGQRDGGGRGLGARSSRPRPPSPSAAADLALQGRPLGEPGGDHRGRHLGRPARGRAGLAPGPRLLSRAAAASTARAPTWRSTCAATTWAPWPRLLPAAPARVQGLVPRHGRLSRADFAAGHLARRAPARRPAAAVPGAHHRQPRAGGGGADPRPRGDPSFYLGEPGHRERAVRLRHRRARRGTRPSTCTSRAPSRRPGPALPAPDFQVEGSLDLLGAVRGTASNPLLNGQGEMRGGEADRARLRPGLRRRPRLPELQPRPHRARGAARPPGRRQAAGRRRPRPAAGRARPSPTSCNAAADDVSLRFPEFLLNRGDADLALVSTATRAG